MKGAQILIGDKASKDIYIDSLIQEHKIPSYYVKRFNESLKISQARELISDLSQKIENDKKRIVIFEIPPTNEAQNSLLKTLEELDESTIMVFYSDNVLPTISSRSFTVNVGSENSATNISGDDVNLVKKYLIDGNTIGEGLLFVDNFFLEKRDDPVSDLILLLREIILKEKTQGINKLTMLLKDIVGLYPLVKNNNLSARLVCERVILGYNLP